jgi:hypothetical protein
VSPVVHIVDDDASFRISTGLEAASLAELVMIAERLGNTDPSIPSGEVIG